ncbi:MAG: Na/Pi cotransporter family protein [Clostridiales bacterium]|nr:Na/Pi cotransporter family protein [Clostridiales bacterium]
MDFFSFLKLFLGLAFFLFGMSTMSSGLERMAGGKLEYALKKMTAKPFLSLLLGAGITIAIQSSSATTVMIVGLVNSGIMEFSRTVYVIFGADIGTTLTAWILSLTGIQSDTFILKMLKPENFSPVLAFIGVFMAMISKDEKKKNIGNIFAGFAVLMYGMKFMSDAVSPVAQMPAFTSLLTSFSNPVIGMLIGVVVTAVIQSSAASIGILQALAMTGSITLGMAVPIVIGLNIGTCITAVISCIGTDASAKRVAFVHTAIKVIGALVFLPLYLIVDGVTGKAYSAITVNAVHIALIHSVYNILVTAILMPFAKLLIKLAENMVKDKKKAAQSEEVFKLDDLLLRQPSVAVNECESYTLKMAKLSHEVLLDSFGLMHRYDKNLAKKVLEEEDTIDRLEDAIGSYLVKLSSRAMLPADSHRISKMLHTIGDFERLGDHAVNLMKTAQEMHDKNIAFTGDAERELAVLREAVENIISITMVAFENNDLNLACEVEPLEQVIDSLTVEIKSHHINRLQSGGCTIEMGFVLSDTLTNFERISDHCSNIAVAVIELYKGSFDTHKYLNSIKYDNSRFIETFSKFEQRYRI